MQSRLQTVLLLVLTGAVGRLVYADVRATQARDAAVSNAEALLAQGLAACEAGNGPACADTCGRGLARLPAAFDSALADRLTGCADRAVAVVAVSRGMPSPEADPAAQERLGLVRDRLDQDADPGARALGAALDVALLRNAGALVAARVRLEKAAKDTLDSPWLQWQSGLVALADARLADANAALERVVKALPDFGPGWHQIGLTYLALDRRDTAIAALRKAQGLTDDPQVALDLARAFLAGQLWAEAISPLEAVLRGRPSEIDAVRLLGLANHNLGRHQAAAELYHKAWLLDRQPRTRLSEAISLQSAGQHTAALDALTSLLPQLDQVPEALFLRAGVLADLGRPAESRADYERYLTVARGLPDEAERVKLAEARIAPVPPAP